MLVRLRVQVGFLLRHWSREGVESVMLSFCDERIMQWVGRFDRYWVRCCQEYIRKQLGIGELSVFPSFLVTCILE